jgi:hypothetical protein
MTVLRGYSLKELYEFENDFKKFNIKLPKADKALTAEEMNELYNNEVLMKKLNELAEKNIKFDLLGSVTTRLFDAWNA